jgi:hypothetical protein
MWDLYGKSGFFANAGLQLRILKDLASHNFGQNRPKHGVWL